MRKPFIAICSLLMAGAIPTMAQDESKDSQIGLRLPTQKGSVFLGSSFLYGGADVDRDYTGHRYVSSYDLGLSSRMGYFIKDNLMIGAEISSYFQGSSGPRVQYNQNIQSVGAGVFVRKYFGSATEKDGSLKRLRFFVEAGANYQRSWYSFNDHSEPKYHGTMSQVSFSLTPGVNYLINRNIALEAGLRYTHTLPIEHDLPDQLRVFMGVVWYLGRKK